MRLAIVLIHYHAADWLARAVKALQADLAQSGLAAELIVVDNGSCDDERALIARLPVRHLAAGANLGYAGGVNLGVAHTQAERLILMNPDVEVLPGCVSALLQELERGAAAAGPRFYWDCRKEFLLPPTEERNRRAELWRRLAVRDETWARWALGRWRGHARRHWLAARPLRSGALSGALLAVRRDAWQAVGPFDEGFRLYFEESDWLLRLERQGLRAYYVPAAEAVHYYNQSAAHEPTAAQWFGESAARFGHKHYGARFSALLSKLAPAGDRTLSIPSLPAGQPTLALNFVTAPEQWPLWIELSPSWLGFPAAAMRKEARPPAEPDWQLSEQVWEHLAPGTYYLQITDRLGRSLQRFSFEKPAGD